MILAFNKNINGIQNEIEFVNYLNKRYVYELNPMFFDFILELFGDIKKDDLIFCYKNKLPQKADIFISINGIVKGVSIKKGVKNSIHVEGISSFISFLISNHVKREVIIEFLKYHYADGTTNGSGIHRMDSNEYKKDNQENIDLINETFCDEVLIKKIIDRCIIRGRNSNCDIDAIIYGVVDDFIWIKKDDIYKIISDNKNIYSTGLHFGSLFCQPMDRCINRNPLYEKKRYCIQIKWYNISDDIIKNMYCNSFNKK